MDLAGIEGLELLTGFEGKPGVLLLMGKFGPLIGRLGPLTGSLGPLTGKLGPLIGGLALPI